MFRTLQKLIKIGLLTPSGLFYLIGSAVTEGVNLMTLLKYASKRHQQKIALTDEEEELNYGDLYRQSRQLAVSLQVDYHLQSGQKAALICRSHASMLRAVFASARLGLNVYLLNPEMSRDQFSALTARHGFNFLIYDSEARELFQASDWQNKSLVTYHPTLSSVQSLSEAEITQPAKMKRAFSGEIIVLTGGTTGEPKIARRKPSLLNYLNPFFALLTKLNLDAYRSVYIATPVYHGFGIAAVFINLVLGSRMFLMRRFDTIKGCSLIRRHKIEVVTVVPLMLQRMLDHDSTALESLTCIISGGAALNPALVEKTFEHLGDKLFNLYGTSEAGFSILATPADLRQSPETIGKKIAGVKLSVLDNENRLVADGIVGRICIKSKWAVKTSGEWIETGDVGYRDLSGYIYLRGRNDEMIVSGGENVYPIELENVLLKHPDIQQAAVIGISDPEFGQRLKAYIVCAPENQIAVAKIYDWLSTRVARFQMPAAIELVDDLPVTSVGKINKKLLLKKSAA